MLDVVINISLFFAIILFISIVYYSLENIYLLKDGRKLCYDVYGDQDGVPVFYFHSYPGSRLQR